MAKHAAFYAAVAEGAPTARVRRALRRAFGRENAPRRSGSRRAFGRHVIYTAAAMATARPTIHFISLGCPKNRVDTEVMLGVDD